MVIKINTDCQTQVGTEMAWGDNSLGGNRIARARIKEKRGNQTYKLARSLRPRL